MSAKLFGSQQNATAVLTRCHLLWWQLTHAIDFDGWKFQVAAIATVPLQASNRHHTNLCPNTVIGLQQFRWNRSNETCSFAFFYGPSSVNLSNSQSTTAANFIHGRSNFGQRRRDLLQCLVNWFSFFKQEQFFIFQIALMFSEAMKFSIHGSEIT
jgi:hypothetical protein